MNLLNLSIPNAHLSPKGDYDIIHCAHCLSKNKEDIVIGVDKVKLPGVDIVHDLNKFPWPFKDSWFDLISCDTVC